MVNFNNIYRAHQRSNKYTKAEQEAATYKGRAHVGRSLDNNTNNNSEGADQHAESAAEAVNTETHKGESYNAADLVYGGDNTAPDAIIINMVLLLKPQVLEQVINKGVIIAIHSAIEEADKGEEVEEHLALGLKAEGLLNYGLVEGFIALDDLMVKVLLYHIEVSTRYL